MVQLRVFDSSVPVAVAEHSGGVLGFSSPLPGAVTTDAPVSCQH